MTEEQVLAAKKQAFLDYEAKLAAKAEVQKQADLETLAALETKRSEKQDAHITRVNTLNDAFKVADDKLVLQITELSEKLGLKADDNVVSESV